MVDLEPYLTKRQVAERLAVKRAHEAHRRPIVLPLRGAKNLTNG